MPWDSGWRSIWTVHVHIHFFVLFVPVYIHIHVYRLYSVFLYMFIHVSMYLYIYVYIYMFTMHSSKKWWRHGIMGNGPTKNGTGDPKAHGPLSDIGWCTTAFIRYNYSTWYNCHPPKQQLDLKIANVEWRVGKQPAPKPHKWQGRQVGAWKNQLTKLIWRFPEMGVPLNHPFDFREFWIVNHA